MAEDALPTGVRTLDHTADLGIEVTAPSLTSLFERSAAGVIALATATSAVSGPAESAEVRGIRLEAEDAALLLAGWLREVVYLHTVEGRVFRHAEFDRLDERHLEARITLSGASGPPEREIKGVTYHGLEVQREGNGWRARVILDV